MSEKPKQEPVAYFDPQGRGFYWAKPTQIDAPTIVDVPHLPLYTAPPAAAPSEDIEALRRDAERYREQKERSYRLQRLLKECVKVMQANAVFRDTKAHKDLKTRIRAELEDKR